MPEQTRTIVVPTCLGVRRGVGSRGRAVSRVGPLAPPSPASLATTEHPQPHGKPDKRPILRTDSARAYCLLVFIQLDHGFPPKKISYPERRCDFYL